MFISHGIDDLLEVTNSFCKLFIRHVYTTKTCADSSVHLGFTYAYLHVQAIWNELEGMHFLVNFNTK